MFKKVLVLGSGALKIGEAGEFDYSGSQVVKAFKEESLEVILVNPNIATIQTSKVLADKIYFLPVNDFFVEKVIKKERPDAIALSFGGQTALNCGMKLEKKGVLKKYGVKILGTPISAVKISEDRKLFANHLQKIDISTPLSSAAKNLSEAKKIAKELGYPVMVRAGFALGGQGSGVCKNENELTEIVQKAFSFGPQILVEKYLHHFKEVEYEVVRDKFDNCVTVCNMENMDPLGIHTGDSVVVAPSQTLNNFEYHKLREIAIKLVRSLRIVGECNVQFALNPRSKKFEYYVIELNARLSRSSALASKATGYPLAYIAAKLALGQNLTGIQNKVTQTTQACFEPALDYIVVKIPRWDIEKFKGAEEKIGTSMKSVGEVMGIGRTFEEAYQKAIRMLDLDLEGATSEKMLTKNLPWEEQLEPKPKRMFSLAYAMKKGVSIEKIYELTGIDPWFLYRIKNIVDEERKIKNGIKKIKKEQLWRLKQLGFSDRKIGERAGVTGLAIRTLRKKLKVFPSIFQIDTLAGEFPAKTNYLYLTYNGQHHDVEPMNKKSVMVLGSGPYRIGSSVEFDWTTVNTALSLKRYNKKSVMVNCNPETVSTDYDISDRLYFEELTFERIADIYDFENPYGIIISVGGQTPNNRSQSLKAYGCNVLGTDPADIDRAEDRNKFSKLLDELGIIQPPWREFAKLKDAINFATNVGFPVIMRPSYVLSGTMMRICRNKEELSHYLKISGIVSKEFPITVSKFIEDAKEIEFDAVSQKGKIKSYVISEHIENAGVHSGDATIVLPAQKVYTGTERQIKEVAEKLSNALKITGPFNIQFLAKDNNVSVIEINLRSSRTFPFISKVTGIDFISLATDAFFRKAKDVEVLPNHIVATKVAQFSFARLTGADPILHVEMASTGEVACFGESLEEAYLLAALSVGEKIPKKGVFLSVGGDSNKLAFLESARLIDNLGLPIYSTEKTTKFLRKNKIRAKMLHKIHERKNPSVLEYLENKKIDLAINIPVEYSEEEVLDGFLMRRYAVDHNIPLFTDLKKAELFIKAMTSKNLNNLPIKEWEEYA